MDVYEKSMGELSLRRLTIGGTRDVLVCVVFWVVSPVS